MKLPIRYAQLCLLLSPAISACDPAWSGNYHFFWG